MTDRDTAAVPDDRHPLKRIARKIGVGLAAIGGAVSGLATFGAINADQAGAVQEVLAAVGILGAAVSTLLAVFGVVHQGEKVVTPMSDPRADDGTPLIPGARA